MYDPTKPYKEEIVRLIKNTWSTRHVSVRDWLVCEKFVNPKYRHVDGIGTKGFYHWRAKSFHAAVQDALAMNLNDLALMRAVPYEITDHIILPADDHGAFVQTVEHLVRECRMRDIAITGGESSVHDMQSGMEISISMTGFVENRRRNVCEAGDVIIGIESNGLHANGFTKIRELFGEQVRPEFILPTSVYSDLIYSIEKERGGEPIIHGMAHITGGAYTKMKAILAGSDVLLTRSHTLDPHPIFFEIYDRGVPDEELYKIFNCGIGFLFTVNETNADFCLARIRRAGRKADSVGEVVRGENKVRISSKFSQKEVMY